MERTIQGLLIYPNASKQIVVRMAFEAAAGEPDTLTVVMPPQDAALMASVLTAKAAVAVDVQSPTERIMVPR